MTDRRFPRGLYQHGTEPDPRFSLANERTFLAWVRTSLALIAAGVALEAFAVPMEPIMRLAASVLLIAVGVAAPVQAWFGWLRTERSMRMGAPLPSARLALPLVIVVGAAGVIVLVGLALAP